MIKGAIFDFDGTLFDSMFIWDTVGENYLRSIGYQPKESLNEIFKNMSLEQAAYYYKSEYGVMLSAEEIMNGINSMIEVCYINTVQPKQGVISFLNQLREKGIKMCIATATDKYLIESALKRCNMCEYFSEIFTCNSVGSGKDKPVIYRTAMKHLKTDKTETIVFEDALYAVKTAKADGFITAAVYDFYEKEQEEIIKLADLYITDFSDLNQFWKFALKN